MLNFDPQISLQTAASPPLRLLYRATQAVATSSTAGLKVGFCSFEALNIVMLLTRTTMKLDGDSVRGGL